MIGRDLVRAIEAEVAARDVAYDPRDLARFVEQEFLGIEADPDGALRAMVKLSRRGRALNHHVTRNSNRGPSQVQRLVGWHLTSPNISL
jgi:hypothetical protein